MAKKQNIAGHRKRAFRIRSHQVPEAVHIIMEHMHDLCLELGICPQCKARLLHATRSRVYSKCAECLQYDREYKRR